MRSLPPANYAKLPRLAPPAAYICVIRDVDSDQYRLQASDRPRDLIEAINAEAERKFGLEIVSILEAEDLKASASILYERHHARLSEEWHALDDYQLEELRRSILQIYAHRSFYLTPQGGRKLAQRRLKPAANAPREELGYGALMISNLDASGKPLWREHQQSHPPRGVNASARNSPGPSMRAQAFDLKQYLWDRFLTLLTNHPFKVIYALALLLVLCLALGLIYGYHATHNVAWP